MHSYDWMFVRTSTYSNGYAWLTLCNKTKERDKKRGGNQDKTNYSAGERRRDEGERIGND